MFVCEWYGLKFVVYLDDLLCFIFGLLCIVLIIEDIDVLIIVVLSLMNGIIMCIGFYGVCGDNDLVRMIEVYGDRIYFVYLCLIKCEEN